MNAEGLEGKQKEASQRYDALIGQRNEIDVELYRLQGEHRAYEKLKDELVVHEEALAEEEEDATIKPRGKQSKSAIRRK